MSTTDGPRARDLRAGFRESERAASRLRLLEAAALAIADERDTRAALRATLAYALRFAAADAALVLRYEGGALTVQAVQGPGLPPGARVPLAGAIASTLKSPLLVRERVVSPLRLAGHGSIAVEIMVPLRVRGDACGLLVLSSARPIALPDAADSVTLQALAGLIGAAIDTPSAPRAARHARREATTLLTRLTPREQQVFALLPSGGSNADIAAQLGIAPGTVKVHVERILHKLNLRDRTRAAVRAMEWGLGR